MKTSRSGCRDVPPARQGGIPVKHICAEEVDARLAADDPGWPLRSGTAGLDDALDAIGLALASSAVPAAEAQRRPAPRWRPKRPMVALTAALTMAAGGVATADVLLSAHTGQYANGWQIAAGGPGEYLRLAAPNFCRVALQETSDIPFPAGDQSWRLWMLVQTGISHVNVDGSCGSSGQGGKAEVASGTWRASTAMSAFCAWIYTWRDAQRAGDSATAAQAASEISSALSWNAVTAVDPDPTAGPLHETGEGLTGDHSLFGWFKPFQAAVSNNDVSTVDQLITSHYGGAGCSSYDPPATSRGGTINPAAS